MNDVYAKRAGSIFMLSAFITGAICGIISGLTGFVLGGITGALVGVVIDILEAKRERKFNASVVTGWKPS